MAGKKIIVVFGATGAQGGSVVQALLQDKSFLVRAVTRDCTKPAAQKLEEAGAEVITADLDNEKSVKSALFRAYGAFVVTNFWEHMSKKKEVKQGKCIADLCKEEGLQHVVYSGLENVWKLTGGKLEVPHFDGKGEVEEYFRQIKVPMTSLRLPFYFENLLTNFRPQKSPDGKTYQLAIPMRDIAMDGISVADLGPVVRTVLKNPTENIGKDIGLSAEKLTIAQYAEIMSEVTGKTFVDSKITPEAYQKLNFPGAREITSMFLFYHIKPDRNVELTRKLNPDLKCFKEFMQLHKDTFNES